MSLCEKHSEKQPTASEVLTDKYVTADHTILCYECMLKDPMTQKRNKINVIKY